MPVKLSLAYRGSSSYLYLLYPMNHVALMHIHDDRHVITLPSVHTTEHRNYWLGGLAIMLWNIGQ